MKRKEELEKKRERMNKLRQVIMGEKGVKAKPVEDKKEKEVAKSAPDKKVDAKDSDKRKRDEERTYRKHKHHERHHKRKHHRDSSSERRLSRSRSRTPSGNRERRRNRSPSSSAEHIRPKRVPLDENERLEAELRQLAMESIKAKGKK